MTTIATRHSGLALVLVTVMLAACTSDGGGDPESRSFRLSIQQVGMGYDVFESGVFTTPLGMSDPAPLLPGETYAFEVHAAPGHKVSFATMMVQSNDLFYAPEPGGIALFDESGAPVSGDVTDRVMLWDAGTEANQEPGLGEDQAPRQSGVDTGAADSLTTVRPAEDTFSNLPAVADVLSVTVTHEGEDTFTISIENVSDDATLATSDGGTTAVPVAPGAWAVHGGADPIFRSGGMSSPGLEALAEDGDPSGLYADLEALTGLTAPLAPGVWVVQEGGSALFEPGTEDLGMGLEALAEDGDPSALASAFEGLESGVFDTPHGFADPGPLTPGQTYSFTFEAVPGERLFFATMFVQSNDLFYGPTEDGIELFDADGMALSGDVTGHVFLWDAGTEVNQRPGTGSNQPLRQSGPDTGVDEMGPVVLVDDGFAYPAVDSVIRVTLEAL